MEPVNDPGIINLNTTLPSECAASSGTWGWGWERALENLALDVDRFSLEVAHFSSSQHPLARTSPKDRLIARGRKPLRLKEEER